MIGVFVFFLSFASQIWAEAEDVIISEVQAVSDNGLIDFEGDPSDWIEIFNSGNTTLILNNWSLSDDKGELDKWKFPLVVLEPEQFMVVLASGKDIRNPAGELHTNFKLSGNGEFLALVKPDGTINSIFEPEYPPQVPYATYGVHMDSNF